MAWLNINHDFGLPYVVFTVSPRRLTLWCRDRGEGVDLNDPVKMERSMTALIEEKRPDLKGGILALMSTRGGLEIQLYYYHQSLPKVKIVDAHNKEPMVNLFPEDEWWNDTPAVVEAKP